MIDEPLKDLFSNVLNRLLNRETLAYETIQKLFEQIFEENLTPAQIAGFLIALRAKGEHIDEIVAVVRVLRARMRAIHFRNQTSIPIVDTCGTGGDGSRTINISTLAAIVIAACGVPVAKHGNRAVSSSTGSADFVEALGIPIDAADGDFDTRLERSLHDANIAFLFAPRFHPALRHVASIRRELGVRTLFNLIGPLLNPANVQRQLIGVYDFERRQLLAEALRQLGSQRAWIVHARHEEGSGLDEISPSGPTHITELSEEGALHEFVIHPEDLGLLPISLHELRGGSVQKNLEISHRILAGELLPTRTAVVLNAACTLVIAGVASDLRQAREWVEEVLNQGKAYQTLEKWRRSMNNPIETIK